MQSISLVSALNWRQRHSGDHPLFKMTIPKDATEPTGADHLRSLAARHQIKPTSYSMSLLEMGVLCTLLAEQRPDTLVEFGCGVSTELLVALQASHGYPRRIISFDQSADYISGLRARLGNRGSDGQGGLELVHAPLVDVDIDGCHLKFYDPQVIEETLGSLRGQINLFFVDGPSGGDWNRLAAGVIASEWGATDASLVLHDALRDWELGCAYVWESLGLIRSARVYPYGHGILAATVQRTEHSSLPEGTRASSTERYSLSLKNERISLKETMEASKSLVSSGKRKRVSVSARTLDQLHFTAVSMAPERRFQLQKPRNFDCLSSAQQERLRMRDVVKTLPGGKLWRLGAVVLTGRAQILTGNAVIAENMEGEYSWQGLTRQGKGWEIEIDRDLDVIEHPALIIEKHGVKNYALWWMEILPRVYFAYHHSRNAPRHIVLSESSLLDERTRRFHEETLQLVAGEDIRITYATRDTLVMDAWLPNVSHFSRSKTRWNAHTREFRDFILSACQTRLAKSRFHRTTNRRLFVMRQDSHARRLKNPDALIKALVRRQFLPVTPGGLDWIDQMALFSRAQIVAGVHGAGLLNLLWCTPGTQFVEAFTPPTLNRNTFRHIASQLELPYRVYVEDESRIVNNSGGTDSIELDLDVPRFTALLDEAVSAYRRERRWWARTGRRWGL